MMDQYQEYIHKSRYARFLPEEGRRESWEETVERLVAFWRARVDENPNMSQKDKNELLEELG